ncbi:hypothetical protein BC827DRAFT_265208 [Russula dissimulans]|nr:hypothetical protein BC827DRAFT_265208 [Russula dissimulans]
MSYLQRSAPRICQVEFDCTSMTHEDEGVSNFKAPSITVVKVATLSTEIAIELESTIGQNDRNATVIKRSSTLNPSMQPFPKRDTLQEHEYVHVLPRQTAVRSFTLICYLPSQPRPSLFFSLFPLPPHRFLCPPGCTPIIPSLAVSPLPQFA